MHIWVIIPCLIFINVELIYKTSARSDLQSDRPEYKHLQCGNDPFHILRHLWLYNNIYQSTQPTVIACRAIDVIFRFFHYFLFDRIHV